MALPQETVEEHGCTAQYIALHDDNKCNFAGRSIMNLLTNSNEILCVNNYRRMDAV
jgi:hypothetical protein